MQSNAGAINDNLTFLSEIHGNTPTNIALDLSGSPFRVLWMAHQHTWRENGVQIFQSVPFQPEAFMNLSQADLSALIGSRICHDLISPIGAINNGLELLDMAGGQSGPEMDLIQQSVGNASARIRYFRVAFGAAGEQTMGRSEIISILEDVMQGARLNVAWGPMDAQPRSHVRLAFLALLCVEAAMPYGGRIEISQNDGKWLLHGHAEKLNIDPLLWEILSTKDAPSDLRPAQVQFALLPLIAADMDRRVQVQMADDTVKLSF